MAAINVTGWYELMDGRMVSAVYTMFNTAMGGWTVFFLFMVYQFMLYLKTRNWTLMFISTLIFVSMFVVVPGAGAMLFIKTQVYHVLYAILALELAGIIFMWFWK